ncbi:MAG: hypothetical protein NZM38_04605 [Cytophagales bacterium]|nr:hypothetical protein [Cytophagales bacterium]MDW8384034.1 hypothetical protein [Flammeovirgaceae bacterium]
MKIYLSEAFFSVFKWLLIFLTIVVIGVVIWVYSLPLLPYRAIPHHAFLVVNAHLKPFSNPQNNWLKNFEKIPEFKKLFEYKQKVDSLSKKSPELFLLLQQERIWFSLHQISQYEIAWLVVTSSPVKERHHPHTWAIDLLKKHAISLPFHLTRRQYEKFLIYELTDSLGKPQFSFTTAQNLMIIASSGILLDEAIRTITGKQNDISSWIAEILLSEQKHVWQCYVNLKEMFSSNAWAAFEIYVDSIGISFKGKTNWAQHPVEVDTSFQYFFEKYYSKFSPLIAHWLYTNKKHLGKLDRISIRANGKDSALVRLQVSHQRRVSVKVLNTQHLSEVAYSEFIPYKKDSQLFFYAIQDAEDIYYIFDRRGYLLEKIALDDLASQQTIFLKVLQQDAFVWTCGNHLFAINEKGKLINGFPVFIPLNIATHFLSYGFSFSFLVTDIAGNILSFDGKFLKKQPFANVQQKLLNAPRIVTVANQSLLIAVGKEALIKIFYADGKLLNGFPLKFETSLCQDFLVQKGKSFSDTYLHLLSESGEHIVLNLEGKIINRSQVSDNINADFYFLPKGFENALIASYNQKKLDLYNLEHRKISSFLLPYEQTPQISLFWRNPLEDSILLVFFPNKKQTFLYFLHGDLILENPLWTSKMPAVVQFNELSRCLHLLKATNKTVQLLEVCI